MFVLLGLSCNLLSISILKYQIGTSRLLFKKHPSSLRDGLFTGTMLFLCTTLYQQPRSIPSSKGEVRQRRRRGMFFENNHDKNIEIVFSYLDKLAEKFDKPTKKKEKPIKRIGFK